jgi:multiple antibiotic resistance protein
MADGDGPAGSEPREHLLNLIMKDFWLCFVPLFVAVDFVGTMPMFVAMVGTSDRIKVRRAITISVITALLVAVLFIFLGEMVLRLMGISVGDFMVAGGIILILLAMRELLTQEKTTLPSNIEALGPVPLGVPLIVGPAVLTTIMLLVRQHGFLITTVAAVVNIVLAGAAFAVAGQVIRLIGASGAQIASKIANLLLAAIAVMLVRKGIILLISETIVR